MIKYLRVVALALAFVLLLWPGIPLIQFYGPYVLVWVMNGGKP